MSEKKTKFTVIDALIVIVIAVVAVVGVKILMPKLVVTKGSDTIECQILLAEGEYALGEAMKVGDRITMSLTEKDGGEIKDVEIVPAQKMVLDGINGKYVLQEVENKCDIYLTVEVDVEKTDTAFKLGSTVLKVGAETPVRGKGYAASGHIIKIND